MGEWGCASERVVRQSECVCENVCMCECARERERERESARARAKERLLLTKRTIRLRSVGKVVVDDDRPRVLVPLDRVLPRR